MYNIVIFQETDEVEVVPAEWVSNGVCLWPPYKSCKMIKAARNKEQPRQGWRSYQVKLIYTADTYAEARLKLPLAENLTDLQTQDEAEEELPKKSKRKKVHKTADPRAEQTADPRAEQTADPRAEQTADPRAEQTAEQTADPRDNIKVGLLFLGAVRHNRGTSKATAQEIEMWIKRWLHLSMDREGGRRERQERRRARLGNQHLMLIFKADHRFEHF
ncbi:uncharacterized protein LOC118811081 [Colossoma macropomum]|uniref:uncharacterized protein LOC118811081 n=1 Tax=Colossoma macropomum TaxID=42526 RepID=UPI00186468F0|nr:uncharacterized protein LOC118811081 [Colossoma macropomum]